jgi:hypothetical protein
MSEQTAEPCPYCASTESCPHLFLVVDKTFRTAIGGLMRKSFNQRWSALCEAGGDDFDEREPFDELLNEVNDLANASDEYELENGPGGSSQYVNYYIETGTSAAGALAKFSS